MVFTRAIVLKKLSGNEKRQGWCVLTREYGSIDLWIRSSKKDPCLDIGSLLAFSSERKNETNLVRSWYLISHLSLPASWNAALGVELLSVFALVNNILPKGEENPRLYDDIHAYRETIMGGESLLISRLLVLRLVIHAGILDSSMGRSIDCEKICRWLQNAPSEHLKKLRGIDDPLAQEIDRLAHTSLTQYLHA